MKGIYNFENKGDLEPFEGIERIANILYASLDDFNANLVLWAKFFCVLLPTRWRKIWLWMMQLLWIFTITSMKKLMAIVIHCCTNANRSFGFKRSSKCWRRTYYLASWVILTNFMSIVKLSAFVCSCCFKSL